MTRENVNLSELLIPYDNGNLDNVINNGSKDEGTDLHSLNAKACGVSRSDAKPLWFGLLYGSSATLTGFSILGNKPYTEYTEKEYNATLKRLKRRKINIVADPGVDYYPIQKGQLVLLNHQLVVQSVFGSHIQSKLRENTVGLTDLEKDLKQQVKDTGGITLPYGRFIPADSDHKALNYACQGLGAIAMKEYLRTVFKDLAAINLQDKVHYKLQAVIYDEVDFIVRQDKLKAVNDVLQNAYAKVSRTLGLETTYTGECLTGQNWAECH